jgi:hypothetical protein
MSRNSHLSRVTGFVLAIFVALAGISHHANAATTTDVSSGLKSAGVAALPAFLDAATDSITLHFPKALGGGELKFGGTVDADALAEKKFVFTTSEDGALTWKKAFGLTWIDLTNVALTLTIADGEYGISLDGSVGGILAKGAKAKDREVVIDISVVDKKLDDFTFSLPNTTLALNTVPGLKNIPGAKTFKVNGPTVSLDSIGGTVSFSGQDVNMMAFHNGDTSAWTMAMRLEKSLTLGKLVGHKKGLMNKIGLPKMTMFVSTKSLQSGVEDLPLALQQFLTTAKFANDNLDLAEGVTIDTVFDPGGMPKELKSGLKLLGLDQVIPLSGQIGGVFSGKPSVELSAAIEVGGDHGFPILKKKADVGLEFFIQLASGESSLGFRSVAELKGGKNPMIFDVDFAMAQHGTIFEVLVAGHMQGDWKNAAGIKGFTLSEPFISVGINQSGAFDLLLDGKFKVGKTEAEAAANMAVQPAAGFLPQSAAFAGTLNKLPMSSMLDHALKAANIKVGGLKKIKAEFRDIEFAMMSPGAKLPAELEEKLEIQGAGIALNGSLWLHGKELGAVKGYASTDGVSFKGVLDPFKLGPVQLKDANLLIQAGPSVTPKFMMSGDIVLFKGFEEIYELEVSPSKVKLFTETSFGGAFDAAMTVETDGPSFKPGNDLKFEAVLAADYNAAFKKLVTTALKGLKKADKDLKKAENDVKSAERSVKHLKTKIAAANAKAKKKKDKAVSDLKSAQSKVDKLSKTRTSLKNKIHDKKKDFKKAKKKVKVKKAAKLLVEIGKLEVELKGAEAAKKVADKALGVVKKVVKKLPAISPEAAALTTKLGVELAGLETAEGVLKAARGINKGVTAATKAVLKGATAMKIISIGAKGSLLGISSGGKKGTAPKLLIEAKLKGKKAKTYKVGITPKIKFDKIAEKIAKEVAQELVKIFEKG